jgi:hypothetical protein
MLFPIISKRLNSNVLRLNIQFLEGANYIVKGTDQYDWLKMTGIKESGIMPRFNTTMLAFRNVPEKNKIEWAFYSHIGGDTIYRSLNCFTDYSDAVTAEITHTDTLRKVTIVANSVVYSDERRCIQPKAAKIYEVSGILGGTSPDIPKVKISKSYINATTV